ncbi:MAG: long-chain fatty acid--CoA ligase [Solirubrobacteraceae bacterium]|nr:long-chain fatty acid--CoA ligase [Solirubrobacteraceae bacterium]
MEQSTAAGRPRALAAAPVAAAFRITADERPDAVALRTQGGASEWTWREVRERVDALAAGLARLGVRRGDAVALLLSNRPEFHVADLAAMTLGATPFSIYTTSAPEQIRFVLEDAAARVLVAEAALLGGALAARDGLDGLEHVVVVDGDRPPAGCTRLDDVLAAADPEFDPDGSLARIAPDDVVTLIYTSGTTGPPKGVQLTHRNVMAAVATVTELIPMPADGRVISWLPAAHVAERVAHHYLPIAYGLQVTCCPDPRQVVAVLPEVRPSWFFAVPRIWEKLKAGLEAMIAARPDAERAAMQAALDASLRRVRLRQAGEPVPPELEAAWAHADAAIFAPLRAQLGFDRAESVNVGAAPTPVEVLEFFHAIGIPVAELWGMSETTGAGCVNPPGRIRIGTVGPPEPGVEVRLAEDGELLVRGAVVMAGYRNRPDRTADAIDADGWLHTGDIASIDDDGYVRIVDRKKEIIINAAGKNMSPANIEATLKAASPLIGQAAVIGDGRPFITALIVLDSDFAPAWAAQRGIAAADLAELAEQPDVVDAVALAVERANAKLSRVEQIRRFHVVRGDWLPGGVELTPTMKLRRRPILERYAEEIAAMYAD